jgi:HlyD family secretion protein
MNFFLKGFVSRTALIVLALLVIGVFVGGWLYYRGRGVETRDLVMVTRGTILQEVSATGRIESEASADLGFEKGGKISMVRNAVGDRVSSGQVLVELESGDLVASLDKAKADLATQEADLAKAQVVLANYYSDIINISQDAYAKADDTVRNQLDNLFLDDDSTNPKLTFSVNDVSIDNKVRALRLAVTRALAAWREEQLGISAGSSSDSLDSYLAYMKVRAEMVRELLLLTLDAVNNAPSTSLSVTTANSYRTSINTGRTNINIAIDNIVTQEQNIRSQKAAILSAEASVKSYGASVANIQAQLAKNVLRAPISGVVTVQDAKVGEIAGAGISLVSVISDTQLKIEVNTPEADIAKIRIGDAARVTLDAYGSDVVFDARVAMIDPAETLVEGVATYKTTLQFTRKDPRVRPGMTANIDILTEKKEGVLFLPTRALVRKDGAQYVFVDRGPEVEPEERRVEIGVRGSDGNTEILSGLSEGEVVVRQ